MANCPNDGGVLFPSTLKGGAGTYYSCSSCNTWWLGYAGTLMRTTFSTGGQVKFVSNSSFYLVSHALNLVPQSGDIIVTAVGSGVTASGLIAPTAASFTPLTFVVDGGDSGPNVSGVAFVWQYLRT